MNHSILCHDNISSIIVRLNISFSWFSIWDSNLNIALCRGSWCDANPLCAQPDHWNHIDSDDGGDGSDDGNGDDDNVDDDGLGDDDDGDDDGDIGAMPIPFVLSQTFEIILTLEGITPETGNTIQVNLKRINCAIFFPNFQIQFIKQTNINVGRDDHIDSRFRPICYTR